VEKTAVRSTCRRRKSVQRPIRPLGPISPISQRYRNYARHRIARRFIAGYPVNGTARPVGGLCESRLSRRISAAGREGRRPGKILAGGDNHRLSNQPASRPGGAAEDNYLSNSRPSSTPPGRVSFWRLTGGCHHRLISSDPLGQQKAENNGKTDFRRDLFQDGPGHMPGTCTVD
jgi:hypothetical protein